jgi:hypothetical protein
VGAKGDPEINKNSKTTKTQTQRKNMKIRNLSNAARFSRKVEGSTAARLLVFYEKKVYKLQKYNHKKNRQIHNMSKLPSNIDVLKTSRSQRFDDYCCLRKRRSNNRGPFPAARSPDVLGGQKTTSANKYQTCKTEKSV